MSTAFLTNSEVIDQVRLVQAATTLCLSIRAEKGLPLKLRLKEVQVESGLQPFFCKDAREALAEACNVEYVEPAVFDEKYPEDWIEKTSGSIRVKLNINFTPGAWADYQKQKSYRELMVTEKLEGTYNENTWKKYKAI